MRTLDTSIGWDWSDGLLTIRSSAGTVTLTPLADDLIRFRVEGIGGHHYLPSGAVLSRQWKPVAASVHAENGRLLLTTPRLKVVIELTPLRLSWYEGERLFAVDTAIQVGRSEVIVTRQLPADEHFYGFGEKTGFLDKRGRQMEMWATDQGVMVQTDPLYQSIPFFMGLRQGKAHGLFVDCPARSSFDMGSLDPAASYSIHVQHHIYDSYVFAGPGMAEIIQRYTELTGRMELPPLWSLGYHQCRYSYYPEAKVREVARLFRQKDIPCDAIWLDIDYMDGYRVFTWDRERFPRPQELTADLAGQGFRLVTIVDPGVKADPSFPVYQEGVAEDLFVTNPDGTVHVGRVWPGAAAFPDFLKAKTRRWWGDWLRQGYLDAGVAGIWNDMNEPASFLRNAQNEKTLPHETLQGEEGRQVQHKDVHNIYGFRMGQATFEGLKDARPDQRPFVLTRSGYAGIQRYAAVWTGDNYSWWEGLLDSLPICMGLGLSGVPFVGADVGGFGENPNGELMARWLQAGAFYPFFRTHSAKGNRDQEPWSFGPEVEEICRRYIKLRYRLLPFLYTLFEEASRTGMPVMRPLILEHQDDPEACQVSDQFLLGRDLLVAPVYQPGAIRRMVYLPEGTWFNFWTGEELEGRRPILCEAPLDTLPLFVRGGAVIPMGPAMDHVGSDPFDTLTLHLFPGKGQFTLYTDAGEGYDYQDGGLSRLRVQMAPHRAIVAEPAGDFLPPWSQVEIILHGTVGQVTVDGRPAATAPAPGGARRVLVNRQGGFVMEW